MKKFSFIRRIFSVAFTVAVLFTVSVRDTHYLFTQHDVITEEHCENHLHSAEDHTHCAVCKFDASFFTNDIFAPTLTKTSYIVPLPGAVYASAILSQEDSPNYLRGPPAIAWLPSVCCCTA